MTRQFQDPCLVAEAKATRNLSLQTASDQDRPPASDPLGSQGDRWALPSCLAPPRPRLPLPARTTPPRCSEKGCIFPAARETTGKCLDHDRRLCVPELFHSFQPTMLLLDQAKYILPDSEFEDTRHLDRRRLAGDRLVAFEEAA